jgi:hypothetical protein
MWRKNLLPAPDSRELWRRHPGEEVKPERLEPVVEHK